MLEETIVTEPPPWPSCYGRTGQQVSVPLPGERAKRILPGALNIGSGEVPLLITHAWAQQTPQAFLRMARPPGRGRNLVLFEDRGSPHAAEASRALAGALGIEVRWLPKAAPELNAMDQLWRRAKARTLSSRPPQSVDPSADGVCAYIVGLGR
jgi:hypothetical protein